MKELSIKEKARRFDDLLARLQKAKADNNVCDERYCCVIDDIVPELAESEDGRIRKEIIDFLQETINNVGESPSIWTMDNVKKWIAWLEKQGEQGVVLRDTFGYEEGKKKDEKKV